MLLLFIRGALADEAGPTFETQSVAHFLADPDARGNGSKVALETELTLDKQVTLVNGAGTLKCVGRVAPDTRTVTFASGCTAWPGDGLVPLWDLGVAVGEGKPESIYLSAKKGNTLVDVVRGGDGGLEVKASADRWFALVSNDGKWIEHKANSKLPGVLSEERWEAEGVWFASDGNSTVTGTFDVPDKGGSDAAKGTALNVTGLCETRLLDGTAYVRVDLQDPRRNYSPEAILRPNTPIEVCVVAPDESTVTFDMTGSARGLYDAPVDLRNQAQSTGRDTKGVTYAETRATFAPRVPGALDLVVTVTGKDGKSKKTTLEFEIEKVYAGAVRVGIGIPYTPFGRDYDVQTSPGSSTAEVVEANGVGTKADVELVVGYAPFLNRNGRGYYTYSEQHPQPLNWVGQRLAPYVAIGLVDSDTESALDLLHTVYFGAELEFNPHASLAFTGIVRQSEVLRSPYAVGGPAGTASGDDIVTYQYQPGIAVVLNVSPEFLKAARTGIDTSRITP